MKPLLVSSALGASLVVLLLMIPSIALKVAGLDRPRIPLVGAGLQIYDRYDRPVCTIYGERDQQHVKLDKISKYVTQAFIAAEDHDFYWHTGVNPFAILRAILVDVSEGQFVQGGSTISQQLVKNLYFEGKKRDLQVKITEAFMAMDIEKRYSKEQILEAYVNYVYFGRGVYGIQRASEQYFGKGPAKLDLAESAFLAGLVTAPSELSKPEKRKDAIRRQHLILNSMRELKMIDDKQLAAAKKEKLVFRTYTSPARKYRQYTAEVLRLVKEQLDADDEIYKDGLKVYTFLDPAAQAAAERILTAGIRSAPKGINQGALVSISVDDGGVIAMVGGVGPNAEWNRATSPHTAGSAFKPFVYLAGLVTGALQPDELIDDHPLAIQQVGSPTYSPKNYDGDFLGTITIRKAIALSRNTCAVRVAQAVGPSEVVRVARQAGISSKLDENLSLALGSSAVSPLEMANAYATLARNGQVVQPLLVRRITDPNGNVIKEFSQLREQVFEQEPVAQLVDALQDVVEKGTGTRARLFGRPVAGKTGTSDAGKDIWFVGFTPDLVTAVWGGNDENKPVAARVTGGSIMAGIWQNYMSAYYGQHNIPAGEFAQPEHPLLEEPEPLHIWPAPSNLINRFFGGWINFPQEAPYVREYGWRGPTRYSESDDNDFEEEREYQQRWAEREREKEERKREKEERKRKKGIVRKILGWFDD